MSDANIVWIASFPRSGNTLLRTVLWHCFGLRSASIYSNDLGGNSRLEEYVGHIEHRSDGCVQFPPENIPLMKTHDFPKDSHPAIYIIRDGRAATVSLWNYGHRQYPLAVVIEGGRKFGTWSQHVQAWNPWARPNTLLLRYEDLKDNLPIVLSDISQYLKCDILKTAIPDRETIASIDGRWVRSESDWRSVLTGELLKRFYELNEHMLRKAGYLD